MSFIMKIILGIGAVMLVLGSICVTIAALFPPKEYKGDGRKSASDQWDESIEDI